MCRIAGLIHPPFSGAELTGHIKAMCTVQQHGGPDDEGIAIHENQHLALGHRRLSLLDLSPAGHQPMRFGGYEIVFNGEIYNFERLKTELQQLGHVFQSHSDTEVILHAYQQWGKACFSRFNGMFALALYDPQQAEIVLARDVAGIKPLYYYQEGKTLAFASEVKAFSQCGIPLAEDPNWKIYFLSFGFIPEPHSTLEKVKQLAPGTAWSFHLPSGKTQSFCFEQFHFESRYTDRQEVVALIRSELAASVERHLISDAPIGVFLSGGIDSSIISILAAKAAQSPIQTLSVSFQEGAYDESDYQKIVQQQIDSQHTHYRVTEKDYLAALPTLSQAFDQPSNDAINSWFICRCAQQNGLKAVLSGLGGDELFGGYPSFNRIHSANSLRHLPLRLFKIADHLSDDRLKKLVFLSEDRTYADYLFLRGFYTPKTISKLLDATETEIKTALQALTYPNPEKASLHPKNYVSWLEQNIYMRSQLLKDTDYMSMQHGVEVRVPFLDKDFLHLAHQIAPEIKFDPKVPKALLIAAFKEILPPEVWNRKKMGFTFPFQEWNKKHPEIRKISEHGNKQVAKLGQQFLKNKLHWSRCFALLQIEQYLPQKDALFLTLKTFSLTGGIEKVNRVLMKAGTDIQAEHLIRFYAKSLYDDLPDERYITSRRFQGFKQKLLPFIYSSVVKGIRCDVVMFSHINLAAVGVLIKLLSPNTKVLLQAHGIEIWGPQSWLKKLFLKKADLILAVSSYTQEVLVQNHRLPLAKCMVFHNSLDPYFQVEPQPALLKSLKEKYQIGEKDQVLMTLTRLVSSEKYKGYDKVLEAMTHLKPQHPNLKYFILGKYDQIESERILQLVKGYGLEKEVYLTGFIADEAISSYFALADVFVMPSQKEGFGIVFIEAMACGLPVIAGNVDGSVDALHHGELGILVNPHELEELSQAILHYQAHPLAQQPEVLKDKVQTYFGYPHYKEELRKLLMN